jgi:HEAT repeat protein
MNLQYCRCIIAMLSLSMLGQISSAQQGEITAQVIKDLQASRWQVRQNAFERIVAIPDAVDHPESRALLIQLREREDVEAGKEPPDLFEDDDYLAYDERLTSVVQEIAIKFHDRRAWDALVRERYNPDSEYGRWLAGHQEALLSLEALLDSRYVPLRADAVYDIALMLANSKITKPLSIEKYTSLNNRIHTMAAHDEPIVRYNAIKGIGLMNHPEDVAFLEKLASTASDELVEKTALEAAQTIREQVAKGNPK